MYIGTQPYQGFRARHTYTATAGQTSFSGAGAENVTLTYSDEMYIDVYQNGVKLSPADYTATSGTTVVLATGATVSDIVEVVKYDAFSVADTVSAKDGGGFGGNISTSGTLDVTGAITSSAGATITVADNSNTLTLVSTDADANSGPLLDFYRNSGSPADADLIGSMNFRGRNDNSQDVNYGTIIARIEDASDGTEDGRVDFRAIIGGTEGTFMKYHVPSGNEVVFNDGSLDIDFRVESNGNTHAIMVQGGSDCIGIKTASPNDYYADDLVLTAPDEGGMTIRTGSVERAYLAFADGTSGSEAYRGYISYDHNDDTLYLGSSGTGRLIIDGNGHVTTPAQPAFSANATGQTDLAASSVLQIGFATEIYDVNADYNTTNSTFTAPVTGKYQINVNVRVKAIDTGAGYYLIRINTSNKSYDHIFDSDEFSGDLDFAMFSFSVLADMDAADTCIIQFFQNGGTQQTDIDAESHFTGFLAC